MGIVENACESQGYFSSYLQAILSAIFWGGTATLRGNLNSCRTATEDRSQPAGRR